MSGRRAHCVTANQRPSGSEKAKLGRALVIAHVRRLHPASDEGGVRGLEVVDAEGDRRRREVEAVRVVLHQLERHELERERLVGEPDLRDREGPRLGPPLLDHADLLDPEPAAGLRVIHVQHDVSDLHERLPERGACAALARSSAQHSRGRPTVRDLDLTGGVVTDGGCAVARHGAT